METDMEKISFYREDTGEEEEFYILGETIQDGLRYILVTDAMEDGANCMILMEEFTTEEGDIIYSAVRDEAEADALAKIFEELLDDVEIGF